MKKFEKEAAAAQHFDGVYVLKKLLSQHAFWFAATPHPVSFIGLISRNHCICLHQTHPLPSSLPLYSSLPLPSSLPLYS